MKAEKLRLLEELRRSRGIISYACEAAGVSRGTFYNWIKEDKEFCACADDITEAQIDGVERSLLNLIDEGNATATIYYLKTKGKGRGWSESAAANADKGGKNLRDNRDIKGIREVKEFKDIRVSKDFNEFKDGSDNKGGNGDGREFCGGAGDFNGGKEQQAGGQDAARNNAGATINGATGAAGKSGNGARDESAATDIYGKIERKKKYIIKLLKEQGKYTAELSMQADVVAQLLVRTDLLRREIYSAGHKSVNVEISREGNERESINPKERLYLDYLGQSQKALRALGMNTDARERKGDTDEFRSFMETLTGETQ